MFSSHLACVCLRGNSTVIFNKFPTATVKQPLTSQNIQHANSLSIHFDIYQGKKIFTILKEHWEQGQSSQFKK